MAKFRECYVQAGAGSNFLASKCLWAGCGNGHEQVYDSDVPTNEFFFNREKVDPSSLGTQYQGEYTLNYECDHTDLMAQSEKIKPILITLDNWITDNPYITENPVTTSDRNDVIKFVSEIWKQDWSMYTSSYSDFDVFLHESFYIPPEIKDAVINVQDYFGKCREYYYNVCERKGHDSFIITHNSPYLVVSPRLDVPGNFKSLGMELDVEMEMMTCALQSIKSGGTFERYDFLKDETADLYVNRNLKFCDEVVSYRKIFFENDRTEIMKMYEFFDNKEYFHHNRKTIMEEFKEYNDKNMAVINHHMRYIYKKIK